MAIKFSIGEKTKTSKFSSFMGGLICFILSGTGFYVVFFGNNLLGGIPLIPESTNQVMGKVSIFGGAVFTALLSILAFKEFFESGKSQNLK